jgi:hypothetical protein
MEDRMTRSHVRFLTMTLALALVSTVARADPQCKPAVGHFEARVVPPPDCAAPFCTAGRVWGGLQGTYRFTMTSLQPSVAVPTIVFYTGQSVVTTKSGDLVFGTDTGSIDLGPNAGFASLITFTGGTGAMNGASGQIRLRGELNQAEGTTSGDYLGTICTP